MNRLKRFKKYLIVGVKNENKSLKCHGEIGKVKDKIR